MPDVEVIVQTTPIEITANVDHEVLVTAAGVGVQGPSMPSGNYLLRSESGQFYASSNPSGFITGVDFSPYVPKTETGIFITTGETGAFYPTSNPSGFITSAALTPYVTTGQTGAFITSGQTGAFYPTSNPSGFITSAALTPYVTTGQTGAFITSGQTGAFYPTSNPSGYITGIPNIVYTTGNQTISGDKTFAGQVYTMGAVIIDGSGYLDFATIAPAWQEGRVFYDSGSHSLSYYNNVSGITVNLGKEQLLEVRNGESSTIVNGTVVFISGAQGNLPAAYRASRVYAVDQADKVIGIATHDIAHNQAGYITTFGLVHDLNTQAFDEGSQLFLGTGGLFTTTPPTPPDHVVYLGMVTRQHPNDGHILVNVRIGQEIEELCNTSVSGLQSGQALVYDSSRFVWRNQNIVLPSQTGNFITTSQTGEFYPASNPSGFITGVDLTSYITTGQTGAFYASNNPSGFITGVDLSSYVQSSSTGVFVTTGQTGAFYPTTNPSGYITSGQTGAFYPAANPSGFITGVDLTSYVTTGQTEAFITSGQTGAFYPTSNPSGFITGVNLTSYITTGQTGVFQTTITGSSGYLPRFANNNTGLTSSSVFSTGGWLGIQTSSMIAPLDVRGNASISGAVQFRAGANGAGDMSVNGAGTLLLNPSNAGGANVYGTLSPSANNGALGTTNLRWSGEFSQLNVTGLRIYSSYVNATTGSYLELNSTTGRHLITTVSSGTGLIPLQLGINKSPYIYITTGGNVGIANATPNSSYALEVSGHIRSTNRLYLYDDFIQSDGNRNLQVDFISLNPVNSGTQNIGGSTVPWQTSYVKTGVVTAISMIPDTQIATSFNNSFYVFTGNINTGMQFPAISATNGRMYFVKNRGSGILTVSGTSLSGIFSSSVVTTFAINPGESFVFGNDGQYWNVM